MSDQTSLNDLPGLAETKELLESMCASSGLEMHPVVRGRHESYLEVDLVGEDAATTFGRHGRMLDALQYLCNLIITRHVGPDMRVLLDVDGYRGRRAEVLQNLALDFAAQVKARQEECELDPLPPHERRYIHKLLSEDPEIRTYSEGDEPDRHVIIAPR